MKPSNDMSDSAKNEQIGSEPKPLKDANGRLLIPLETLAVLNWLGELGVDGVESRLEQVLADEVTIRAEQLKISHAGAETSLTQFGVEDHAGARVRMETPFSGLVLVLFPVKSANKAASLMLERVLADVESVVSTSMGRDALTELCNMMANGFVDEWATLFDAPFTTGPPTAVQNPELTLLSRITSLSELGLYLTSRIQLVEHEIDAAIFIFPSDERFIAELSQVDAKVIEQDH